MPELLDQTQRHQNYEQVIGGVSLGGKSCFSGIESSWSYERRVASIASEVPEHLELEGRR